MLFHQICNYACIHVGLNAIVAVLTHGLKCDRYMLLLNTYRLLFLVLVSFLIVSSRLSVSLSI